MSRMDYRRYMGSKKAVRKSLKSCLGTYDLCITTVVLRSMFLFSQQSSWHHDVKPSNILVKRRIATSLYNCHFKLADLGLSHFKRHVGPKQGATDRDAFGTHAYGQSTICKC